MKMHGIVWAYILVLILKNLDISRFMEIYRITKPGVYLTMPNFIVFYISFVVKGLRGASNRYAALGNKLALAVLRSLWERAPIAVSLYFSIVFRISQ